MKQAFFLIAIFLIFDSLLALIQKSTGRQFGLNFKFWFFVQVIGGTYLIMESMK